MSTVFFCGTHHGSTRAIFCTNKNTPNNLELPEKQSWSSQSTSSEPVLVVLQATGVSSERPKSGLGFSAGSSHQSEAASNPATIPLIRLREAVTKTRGDPAQASSAAGCTRHRFGRLCLHEETTTLRPAVLSELEYLKTMFQANCTVWRYTRN